MGKNIKFLLICLLFSLLTITNITPMFVDSGDSEKLSTNTLNVSTSSSNEKTTKAKLNRKRKRIDPDETTTLADQELPKESAFKLSNFLLDAIKKFFGAERTYEPKIISASTSTSTITFTAEKTQSTTNNFSDKDSKSYCDDDYVDPNNNNNNNVVTSSSSLPSPSASSPSLSNSTTTHIPALDFAPLAQPEGLHKSSINSTGFCGNDADIDENEQDKLFKLIILNEFEMDDSKMSYLAKAAIEQEAAPILIFGKHLLVNSLKYTLKNFAIKATQIWAEGLKTSSFSSFLSKWIVLDFSYETLEGFLLIPKKYAQKWLYPEDINKLDLKIILTKLGFDLSHTNLSKGETSSIKKINAKIITDESEIKHESNLLTSSKLDTMPRTEFIEKHKQFSELVTFVCEKLVSNNYKKCIYLAGHGASVGNKDYQGGCISSLFIKDAFKLLSTLNSTNTELVYLGTCFLAGANLINLQNMLNTLTPSNMIVISGATSQILTTQFPQSFNKFFEAFEIYLYHEAKKLTPQEKYKYFATHITPWVSKSYNILEQFGWVNSLTTIPQIRVPGNSQTTSFQSLAPFMINAKTLEQASKDNILNFNNAKLLYIDIPQVDLPIVLNQIPLLILGNYISNVHFKKVTVQKPIYAQITEPERVFTFDQTPQSYAGCDFEEFIMNSFIARKTTHFFAGYQHVDIFEIKELDLGKESKLKIGNTNIKLPSILYNLFVIRSRGRCIITFNLSGDVSKDEKMYKFEIKRVQKQKNLDIKVSMINSKDELIKRLTILLQLYCWNRHKEVMAETLKIYPDIKSFI